MQEVLVINSGDSRSHIIPVFGGFMHGGHVGAAWIRTLKCPFGRQKSKKKESLPRLWESSPCKEQELHVRRKIGIVLKGSKTRLTETSREILN